MYNTARNDVENYIFKLFISPSGMIYFTMNVYNRHQAGKPQQVRWDFSWRFTFVFTENFYNMSILWHEKSNQNKLQKIQIILIYFMNLRAATSLLF